MNKGYISIFLVLIITLGISAAVYRFFEQNEYMLILKKDEYIFESKRIVTKVCISMLREKVYAGLGEVDIYSLHISKKIFGITYECKVQYVEIMSIGDSLVYKINLTTPFNLKQVKYIFNPWEIKREITSL